MSKVVFSEPSSSSTVYCGSESCTLKYGKIVKVGSKWEYKPVGNVSASQLRQIADKIDELCITMNTRNWSTSDIKIVCFDACVSSHMGLSIACNALDVFVTVEFPDGRLSSGTILLLPGGSNGRYNQYGETIDRSGNIHKLLKTLPEQLRRRVAEKIIRHASIKADAFDKLCRGK